MAVPEVRRIAAVAPRKLPILERAFELARSGACPGLPDLTRQLKAEGYGGVSTALAGLSLRKQLRELCLRSQREHTGP